MKHTILITIGLLAMLACTGEPVPPHSAVSLDRFASGAEMLKAFEQARDRGGMFDGMMRVATMAESASFAAAPKAAAYSETNIQVAGVDEADIIKTDGNYIYAIAQGRLHIIKAATSDLISTTDLGNNPIELFIQKDRLLVFANGYEDIVRPEPPITGKMIAPRYPYPGRGYVSVSILDISDKKDPETVKEVKFNANYASSRRIGDDVYFVVNSHPQWGEWDDCVSIVPMMKEHTDWVPVVPCTRVGYIPDVRAEQFFTIGSMNMRSGDLQKEVIVGSGQNIYASLNSIYIAQNQHPSYGWLGEPALTPGPERTAVSKFDLDKGKITFAGSGSVPGRILNQFSMDEHEDHFRIATTVGNVWDEKEKSSNNIYILDDALEQVGAVEDLAPGERIYSARFMGDKGYIVTFKKVDPLFVIDLSNPRDPSVLGKLKIPGYSDYLHPIGENHLLGMGKDTVEAEQELTQRRGMDFAWYQGVKLAVFDVSDVENPIELHKEIIGDRGTDSEALHNHKAVLFDEAQDLLVLPITLAEIKGERTSDNQHGDYVFQGAYVYDLSVQEGFKLRGKITHYDTDEVFRKSGFYFRGDSKIRRSLYISDSLYTLSDTRLQQNHLGSLERLGKVTFPGSSQEPEVMY
ncbi:hypothetical protein CMO91_05635 [Candidatus Woesearchaeota archaeon]|nr:hypothetical protein [Candidatus Woesearchaeota archaeon]